MMHCSSAHEAATSTKEEVRTILGQAKESVEHVAVHRAEKNEFL
jgi:hypothetical protein